MIEKERLQSLFCELAAIDSPSLSERALCDRLKQKLKELGISSQEDAAGVQIGGNAGNLYAYIDGTPELSPILLSAHLDTVSPALGKTCILHPDGRMTSDGTTVLGADDLSGVCVILEALRSVLSEKKEHRPLELLFSVSEETYCTGIKQFDFSMLKSREAYVFDLSGAVGRAAYQAPSILSFQAVFHGRSAHAAFSPQDGIHAIKAAADAISRIPCGKIDDATINIGTINGGNADNIVPEHCSITGEVRSFSDESARKKLKDIKAVCLSCAQKLGAAAEFETKTLCRAYCVAPTAPVAVRFQKVCAQLGLSGTLERTYGGSDNNPFFEHGIQGLVVAAGMNNCHSCEEYTSISELEKAAQLVRALILSKE